MPVQVTLDISGRIDQLESRLAGIREEIKSIIADAEFGGDETRDLTAEEDKKIATLNAEAEKIEARVAQLKKAAAQVEAGESRKAQKPSRTAEIDPDDDTLGDPNESRGVVVPTRRDKEARQKYAVAFEQWFRGGELRMTEGMRDTLHTLGKPSAATQAQFEQRAQSAGIGSAGGFTVPQEYHAEIERAMKQYGAMLNTGARLIDTQDGRPHNFTTSNGTARKARIIGENGPTTTAADTTFGNVLLNAYMYTTDEVRATMTLLNDSSTDIASFIAEEMGETMGRGTNEHWTKGTGAGQPLGIVNFASTGATASSASAISFADLRALEASVDPAYRLNAEFMFSDDVYQKLSALVDSQGRPQWQEQARASQGNASQSLIFGKYRYTINQDMASVGASAQSVVFGNFRKFLIRRVREMLIVRADQLALRDGAIAFFGFWSTGSCGLNAGTNPIRRLVHPAS